MSVMYNCDCKFSPDARKDATVVRHHKIRQSLTRKDCMSTT